jgi:hypothetical protein
MSRYPTKRKSFLTWMYRMDEPPTGVPSRAGKMLALVEDGKPEKL